MFRIIIILISLNFIACNNESKANTSDKSETIKLTNPIILNEDLSLEKLTRGKNKISEFEKINKTSFIKNKSGFLACGDSDPLVSSTIYLENEKLGIALDFSNSWIENEESKEEKLSEVTLSKKGSGFNNEVLIGESTKENVISAFGKPDTNEDDYMSYSINQKNLIFNFDASNLLEEITITIH